MYAAIVPNSGHVRQPLRELAVTVNEVERRTGLDFFSAMEDPEEDHLESTLAPGLPAGRGGTLAYNP